jgi:acetyltransferase-like isoleucine patch superfamily enzyme
MIHPTAIIEKGVTIGELTKVWHYAHIREGAHIGVECIISKGVFIDQNVHIGNLVKIQNNVSVYKGVTISDGVFIGPHVCFTNDLIPRAVDLNMKKVSQDEWILTRTSLDIGCSIGANSTILAGIRIGKWAMIGASSVVTKSIPDFALAYGNPAQLKGIVAPSGVKVSDQYLPGSYTDPKNQELFTVNALTDFSES